MTFLRNIWYAAGHAHEASTKPFARTYLNEPVLIYRTESGTLVAMDDRCPHRLAPLHNGIVVGEAIQCPYHGLRFDGTGACVAMPAGGQAPPRARLKVYPIVERHSLLWLWMGDADRADPSTIPDLSDRDTPGVGWFTGNLYCRANYQLLVDNLLDLTHSEFLHPFLASPGWTARNRQTVKQEGNRVTIVNVAENDNILPVMALFKPSLGPIGTTTQTERWDAPGIVRLSVDYESGGDGIVIPSVHLLTPETERTTHYFVRGGQHLDPANEELTARMREGVLAVFQNEDIPLIESQQVYLRGEDLMEHDPAILMTDRGSTLARRQMAKLIRMEQVALAVAAE